MSSLSECQGHTLTLTPSLVPPPLGRARWSLLRVSVTHAHTQTHTHTHHTHTHTPHTHHTHTHTTHRERERLTHKHTTLLIPSCVCGRTMTGGQGRSSLHLEWTQTIVRAELELSQSIKTDEGNRANNTNPISQECRKRLGTEIGNGNGNGILFAAKSEHRFTFNHPICCLSALRSMPHGPVAKSRFTIYNYDI